AVGVVLCIAPEIQNGRKVAGRGPVYRPRDTVRFECDPGYTLNGSRQIQCRDEGTWDLPVPTCIQGKCILCLPPPDIPNGRHTGVIMDGFSYGSSVTYKCDSGYPLTGEASIHCTTKDGLNGEWSARPPRCGGIPCLPPPDIPNGKRTGKFVKNFSYGSAVTYKCDSGFPLIGEASIHCTTEDGLNGVWSAHPPRCGGRVCIGEKPLPALLFHV
uniref:Sushi domain-containing protein n=1 Tax=Chrysemys picta bellii TaxID=8478 RepID=A0A8C3HTY7_CHRPI